MSWPCAGEMNLVQYVLENSGALQCGHMVPVCLPVWSRYSVKVGRENERGTQPTQWCLGLPGSTLLWRIDSAGVRYVHPGDLLS